MLVLQIGRMQMSADLKCVRQLQRQGMAYEFWKSCPFFLFFFFFEVLYLASHSGKADS